MSEAPRRVKSLQRALDVLEFLSEAGRDGFTLSEVVRSVGGSKGNVYSILQTWTDRGFVRDFGDGHGRRYAIGPKTLQIAEAFRTDSSLTEVVMPVLRKLTEVTGLASRLAVLDDGFAVALSKVDAPGPIQFAPYLGRREYPHCSAVGKAMLASLERSKVVEIIKKIGMPKRTDKTMTDMEYLLDEIEEIKSRGYAFDDEEDTEGVFCVGAPIRNSNGSAIGAISVSGLKANKTIDDMHEIGRIVLKHAGEVSFR